MSSKRNLGVVVALLMCGANLIGLHGPGGAVAAGANAAYTAPQVTISDWHVPDGFGPGNNVTSDGQITALMTDGLTGMDDKAELYADVAVQLPTVKNGGVKLINGKQQVTWKFKPNTKWADGTPITARQAIFNVKLTETTEGGGSQAYSLITAMSAPDDTTLVITYKTTYASYLYGAPTLTNYADLAKKYHAGDISPYATASYDAAQWAVFTNGSTYKGSSMRTVAAAWSADAFTTPDDGAWNGPYKLGEFVPDQRITVTPNPYYTILPPGKDGNGHDLPRPAKIVFVVVSANEAAFVTALQSPNTQVDTAAGLTPDDLPVLYSIKRFHTIAQPAYVTELIGLNRVGPLTDVRVRQALDYAIDKVQLIHQLFPQYKNPAAFAFNGGGFLPRVSPYYDTALQPNYDLDKAIALMKAAGYQTDLNKPGKHLFLTLHTSPKPIRQRSVLIIARDWRKIGVIAQHVVVPTNGNGGIYSPYSQYGLLARRNYQAAEQGFVGNPDPDQALPQFLPEFIPTGTSNSAAQQNQTGTNDPIITNALLQEQKALDGAQRRKWLNIFQEQAAKQVSYIPLWVEPNVSVVNGTIVNFRPNPTQFSNNWNAYQWSKIAQAQ